MFGHSDIRTVSAYALPWAGTPESSIFSLNRLASPSDFNYCWPPAMSPLVIHSPTRTPGPYRGTSRTTPRVRYRPLRETMNGEGFFHQLTQLFDAK